MLSEEKNRGTAGLYTGLQAFLETPEGKTVTADELAGLREFWEGARAGLREDSREADAGDWCRWLAAVRHMALVGPYSQMFADIRKNIEGRLQHVTHNIFVAEQMRTPEAAAEYLEEAERTLMSIFRKLNDARMVVATIKHPALRQEAAPSTLALKEAGT